MTYDQTMPPQVLAFDVFGTVVDWHGSVAREVNALYPGVDGDAFALAWRAGYQPAMRRVMSGELGWTLIDDLHRMILDELLPRFGLGDLAEAERAGLPWDCILSAEVFRAYKPDPATYLGVARVFDLNPNQVMLVAAHQDDLAAARACGLQTAHIERPAEFGLAHIKDVSPDPANTLHARDLLDLADQLSSS